MKLKCIGKLCTQRAEVDILQKIDKSGLVRRFVGDGNAFYEVGELGDAVNLDIMQTIFDVKKEDRPYWTYSNNTHAADPLLEDEYEGEEQLQMIDLRLKWHGLELIPFSHTCGICFIDADYLAPLRDEIKEGGVGFYKRPALQAVTVKNGMCKAIACIVFSAVPEAAVDALFQIYRAIENETAQKCQKNAMEYA